MSNATLEKFPSPVDWINYFAHVSSASPSTKDLAEVYLAELRSALVTAALRLLNRQGALDSATLAAYLFSRTALPLTKGKMRPAALFEGALSEEWLERACEECADFALSVWEPDTATRIKKWASQAGRKGKRGPSYTVAHLDRVPEHLRTDYRSVMRHLGVSDITARRLITEARS